MGGGCEDVEQEGGAMSELIVRREPDRGVRVIHDHGHGFENKILLSMDEARTLWRILDGMLHGLVCPPECSNGIDMVPETINIDGHRLDVWTCPVCGKMRTRRV